MTWYWSSSRAEVRGNKRGQTRLSVSSHDLGTPWVRFSQELSPGDPLTFSRQPPGPMQGLEGEVAFREVRMAEIREVLRLWGQGMAKKRIERPVSLAADRYPA